jgi:alkylation response protein AidB-like acyl-CoA dehydrogenase
VKLTRNRVDQATADLIMDLLGAEGSLGGTYDWQTRGVARTDQLHYMRTRASTIGGGTSQIMQNLIGERILGLPGDIRVDKDAPWNQIRRS